MITVETAVHRFRRDLTFSTLLKGALGGAAIVSLLLSAFPAIKGVDGTFLLVFVGGVWLVLSYRSVKGSRLAAESPSLIAGGHFAEAEAQIEQALRSFSLFRTAKVLSLHHLALLRHAQRRWRESAILSRALLGQRLGPLQPLAKPSRLILADALLELGDLRGAYEAINGLYGQRLTLAEAMNLLAVQLDYSARIGAWEAMMESRLAKVQLAEILPAASSARVQAFLALAARKTGRLDWSQWLARRVELLTDVKELCQERPALLEIWPAAREAPVAIVP